MAMMFFVASLVFKFASEKHPYWLGKVSGM
jgi:hypothetical protein